jgi:hypothetical protein
LNLIKFAGDNNKNKRLGTKKILTTITLVLLAMLPTEAQNFIVSGRVVSDGDKKAVEFAYVTINDNDLWAVTDDKGYFEVKRVPKGKATLTVQCLGYNKYTLAFNVEKNIENLTIRLKESNLALEDVEVVAKRKDNAQTTSYNIDRMTLDNQQTLNVSDLQTLLPGGKTVNSTLMSDNRLALRSGSLEKGNASFGTAIDVDGVRLDNNAATNETMSNSTRSLSSSNIESVEIVTGIPSVEYGDLSNGIVKVSTRKGKSPFIFEGKINQHTKQISVSKGVELSNNGGVLNTSFEHARSFSDAASPHTAYQRNILTLHYMNVFMRNSTPLTLNLGFTGNIGGYKSEADPDEVMNDYDKVRDNVVSGNFELDWLLNKSWITNLSMKGSVSYSDKLSTSYYNSSSSTTQPYIHSTEEGYFIAENYEENPNASIVLGPTGYWYVKEFVDSKPFTYSLNIKAHWSKLFGKVRNRIMLGADYNASKNEGKGNYYDDMKYAPTWREYQYKDLPTMNDLAFYVEDKLNIPTSKISFFDLTAGLRNDMTIINGSDYGTVSTLSPRFNGRYIFWNNQRKKLVSDLSIHAGWGKSVKLPSFQVLYPAPTYSDLLAFAPGTTADNKVFYAYYTHPSKSIYNPDLNWQYTNQLDFGVEFTIKGTRVSLSAFNNKTFNSYMEVSSYTPITYKFTNQAALKNIGIAVANRSYSIDQQTGVVTVTDKTGTVSPVQLAYKERNTYNINHYYVNASPVKRYGLEWTVDFAQIKALRTSLRLDGNYYYYKGKDESLIAYIPTGTTSTMTNGDLYQYVGYYRGCSATSTSYTATASVNNGGISKQVNLNATFTTHIPKIRMIMALRIESSLYNYQRALCEVSDGARGYVLADANDIESTEVYDGSQKNKFVIVYPEYYSTWNDPTTLIPFSEKLAWAKKNDQALYNDLSKLCVRSSFAYTLNPNRLSKYYSVNFSVTKEIGEHVSISFYANNFLNNMHKVHSSQTDIDTSLFQSGYIANYYYGLSLRLKI